jgi:hypothetical protein
VEQVDPESIIKSSPPAGIEALEIIGGVRRQSDLEKHFGQNIARFESSGKPASIFSRLSDIRCFGPRLLHA